MTTEKKTTTTKSSTKKVELYKLSNPNHQYADKDFSLAGNQEKELPSVITQELQARIDSGFIVKVGD